jgi:hypothetical protein
MSKAIRFGLAAGLALATSAPVWAGEEESHEAISDTPNASETAARVAKISPRITGNEDFLTFDDPVTASGNGSDVQAESGSGGPIASAAARIAAASTPDETSNEKAIASTPSTSQNASAATTEVQPVVTSATGSAIEAGIGTGTPMHSRREGAAYEVKAFSDERWLRDRKGYRDGGY